MAAKTSALKKPATKKAAPRKPSKPTPVGDGRTRADFGAPVSEYFAKQTPEKRALLERLDALIRKVVPGGTASIKWGVPVYGKSGKAFCAIAAFKNHVGMNFFADPAALADPDKRLEGAGLASRMLKLRTASDLDTASITRWIKAAIASTE